VSKSTPYVKAWRARQPNLREIRREEARLRRLKHGPKIAAYKKQWRQQNIELVRASDAALARKRRRLDPEASRRKVQRQREKRDARLAALAGRPKTSECELCGETAKTVFDHDHVSGSFRGWLCDRCNRTLGQIKDDISLLLKMAEYLHRGGVCGQAISRNAQRASGF